MWTVVSLREMIYCTQKVFSFGVSLNFDTSGFILLSKVKCFVPTFKKRVVWPTLLSPALDLVLYWQHTLAQQGSASKKPCWHQGLLGWSVPGIPGRKCILTWDIPGAAGPAQPFFLLPLWPTAGWESVQTVLSGVSSVEWRGSYVRRWWWGSVNHCRMCGDSIAVWWRERFHGSESNICPL